MEKDQGLLLHQINYSDSALILKVFFRNYGLKALFARKPKKRANIHIHDYYTLSFENKSNQRIASLKSSDYLTALNTIIHREHSFSWLFINELILKTSIDGEANKQLFDSIVAIRSTLTQHLPTVNPIKLGLLSILYHNGLLRDDQIPFLTENEMSILNFIELKSSARVPYKQDDLIEQVIIGFDIKHLQTLDFIN